MNKDGRRKHGVGTKSPYRERMLSDASTHSWNTRKTTASQTTMKRNHKSYQSTHASSPPRRNSKKPGNKLSPTSPSKKSSTLSRESVGSNSSVNSPGNRSRSSSQSSMDREGYLSSPERKKNNRSKSSVSSASTSSSKRDSVSSQAGSPSRGNNSLGQSQIQITTKQITSPRQNNNLSSTHRNNKSLGINTNSSSKTLMHSNRRVSTTSKNSSYGGGGASRKKPQASQKVLQPNTRDSPSKTKAPEKISSSRNGPNTTRKNVHNVNLRQKNQKAKPKNNQNNKKNELHKSIPVSDIQLPLASQQMVNDLSKSNLSNISPIHDSLTELNKYSRKNETNTGDGSSQYVPKHNLHLALNNCQWETMFNILKELSNDTEHLLSEINVMSNDDASVLHTACWKAPFGLTHIILSLLPTQGAEAKVLFLKQDKDGNTPLHLLCANMMPYFDELSKPVLDITLLESLIAKAPDVLLMQNIQGETPLHLFVTSIAASTTKSSTFQPSHGISAKSTQALRIIFENLPSKTSAMIKDNIGATPFHTAIANGADEALLRSYLDFCPAVCKVEDLNGYIPLHFAFCFDVQASVVKQMVDIYQYGPCHKSKYGDTPLHVLIRNSADDVVLNEKTDQIGKKKLLNRNSIQILELLMGSPKLTLMEDGKSLNEGYDPLFITNSEQLTPIHCCALFNASTQTTQIIMAHPSAEKAALVTNEYGATPLHLAAAQPNVCVDISISVGTTESAIAQDNSKRTPLHIAVLNKNATTGLIECIVDLNPSCIGMADEKKNTALHLACQCGAKEHIVEALLTASEKGCADEQNDELNTPLHEAIKSNASIDVVKMLLDYYKEALNIVNEDGDSPLELAVRTEASTEIVELLIEAGS